MISALNRPRVLRTAAAGVVAAAALAITVPAGAAPPAPKPDHTYGLGEGKTCVAQDTKTPLKAVRSGVSWGQRLLDYPRLHDLATGSGVTVALIDTGVTPNSSAFGARLSGGGDYVVNGARGLVDCDGHGTLVAGIIAASADSSTGFSGIAPRARLLSIRQSSDLYSYKTGNTEHTAGTPNTLALAIEVAVARGADVINISEAACNVQKDSDGAGELARLRAAVAIANASGAVVVAAAGNLSQNSGPCAAQNSGGKVSTQVSPANIPGVLAVAAADTDGAAAAFSIAGPWVDVAAPGTQIISTTPLPGRSGQVDRERAGGDAALGTIQGTSFAAPYVSGLVALIKQRFGPALTPAQIAHRIEYTADHPSEDGGHDESVGYGMIDPVAALTDAVPGENTTPVQPATAPQALPPGRAATDPQHTARLVALIGGVVALAVIVAGVITVATRRRTRAAGSAAGSALSGRSPAGRR